MTRRLSRTIALLVTTSLAGIGSAAAQTLPTDGQVVRGEASIATGAPGSMTIEQKTNQAVIDWQSFSVGEGARLDILQPDASARLLNRVTGDTRSTIAGQIHANGQVFLVNPNGIVITPTGTVDASSFVASTLGISNEDFLAGRYDFAGAGAAAVVNGGSIRVVRGGYAALIGGAVRNDGLIAVELGKVGLGAGEAVTLDPGGNGFLQVALPSRAAGEGALVENAGAILARGGRVVLRADAARELVRRTVNMSGVIEARSVSGRDGAIVLDGGQGTLTVSGTLDAASDAMGGGALTLTGRDIVLAGAKLDASGAMDGGAIRIGGDWQGGGSLARAETLAVDAGTLIDASARSTGTGGSVVLWSDGETRFAGTIRAVGGADGGDGGNAEVSGKSILAYSGSADLRAALGNWGTLLLDPYNLTLAGTGGSNFTAQADDSVLSAATLVQQLAIGNVVVSTGASGSQAGNIVVAAPITWNQSSTLTLSAAGKIQVNENITVAGGGKVQLNHGSGLNFALGSGIAFAPGQSGQALAINGTNYTLVRTLADLRAIDSNRTGNFALANGIDLAGTPLVGSVFGESGSFGGRLEGLGNSISNLKINGRSNNWTGFIGATETATTISNLLLLNVDISGSFNVGGVVGLNAGTIRNVFVSGVVNAVGRGGGIAGVNRQGAILDSISAVAVLVQSGSAGGIAGENTNGGWISNTLSLGPVQGYFQLGGIVGVNFANVANSIATGWVNVTGEIGEYGGLVGSGAGATNSYYDGDVAGIGGGTTTAMLTNGSVPAGLDANIWGAGAGLYPYLKSFFPNGVSLATGTAYRGAGNTPAARARVTLYAGGGVVGFGVSGANGLYGAMVRADRVSGDRVILAQDLNGTLGGVYGGGAVLAGATVHSGWLDIDRSGAAVATNGLAAGVAAAAGGNLGLSSFANLRLAADRITVDSAIALSGTLVLSAGTSAGKAAGTSLSAGALLALGGDIDLGQVTIGTVAGASSRLVFGTSGDLVVDRIGDINTSSFDGIAGGSLTDLGAAGSIRLNSRITGGGEVRLRAKGAFVNRAGPDAVSGRWLIYSASPAGNDFGGLDSMNRAVWNTTTDMMPAVSGNHYVFAYRPALEVLPYNSIKSYGDSAGLSYYISPLQSGVAGAFLGDGLSGTVSVSSAGAAGTAGVGNYAITVDTSALIVPEGYELRTSSATLTVNRRAIDVFANSVTRVYGEANPGLTYLVGGGGLVNGDTLAGGLATSAAQGSGVGGYAITQGTLANASYVINFIGGTLSVTPRAISIAANAATRVYGDADPVFTYSVGGMGLVNGDTLTGALAGNATAVSSVGSYRIGQGTLAASANYVVTGYSDAALTVTPRAIQVTADSLSRAYGDANPLLSYTVGGMGLANGDTLSGALATAATTGSGVGSYAIGQGTLAASSNYSFGFTGSTLMVTPRLISVIVDPKSRVYGGANPELTYTLAGTLVNGDTISGMLATAATSGSNVGNYAITQGSLAVSSNYLLNYVGANLSILPRPVLIYAHDVSRSYGDANPAIGYSVVGLLNGDVVTGALAGPGAGASVGSYGVTLGSLAASPNYQLSVMSGTVTVMPRAISIVADPMTRYYGEANPTLTYTITGGSLPNGDLLSGALSTGATIGSGVGSYAITLGTLAAAGNYVIDFTGGTLTVAPRPITVIADARQRIYGEANPVLSYTVGGLGLVNGDALSGALATGADVRSGVGGYAITLGTIAGANYAISYTGSTLNITPRVITIAADTLARVYGDTNPALSYSVGGLGLVNGDTLTGALATSADARSNVGNYAIGQGTLAASANYHVIGFTGADLAVTPRPLVIQANDLSRIYGNADPVLSYVANGLVNGDMLTGLLAGPGGGASVGSYAIGLGTLSASPNYQLSMGGGTVTVTPRLISVVADPLSRIYGEANPALTYSITGGTLPNGDTLTGVLSTGATIGSGVGGYAITLGSLAAPANYAIDFTGSTLTILPRPITISADAATRIYGDANPALSYTVGGMGLVNGDALGGALATDADVRSGVGNYAIAQGSLANANYAISYIGNTLSVTPRTISIAANAATRVYGDANPPLTYSVGGMGLANGDTLTGALATSADTGSNVGAYAIRQGSLAASGNYAVTGFTGADLLVTPRTISIAADAAARAYGDANPALSYTVGGMGLVNGDTLSGALATAATTGSSVGGYAITQGTLAASSNYLVTGFQAGMLTVVPREIVITADNQQRAYGNANPVFTYRVGGAGLVNGDTLTGWLATVADARSGVGGYAIDQGTLAASANYTMRYEGGTLTVTPRAILVSAHDAQRIYGDADPVFGYSVGGLGLVNGDTLSGALASVADLRSGVGDYAITQGTLTGSNYAISYAGGILSVTPRTISIAADTLARVYGDANPALSYSVGGLGLVNGDTLTGALATSADARSNVGNYAIGQGTLAASANYHVIGFTGADLAVTPRPLVIQANDLSRIYGNADPVLSYVANGLVNGDMLTGLLAGPGGGASVGSYAIGLGTLSASPNYQLSMGGGTVTVTPRLISVVADPLSRIYGEANPALTYSITGGTLPNGDTLTGVLSTGATIGSGVGGYAITLGSLAAPANYAIDFTGSTLTILPRPITISADAATRIYGDANPALSYTVGGMGLVNGDALGGALATDADVRSGVGNYAIAQGSLANANYAISYIGNTLSVTPRTISIAANAATRVYGDANPPLTYSIGGKGLVNGDTLSGALITAAAAGSNVGSYAIGQGSLAASSNYVVTGFTGATLAVTPRTISLTASNQQRAYGDANPVLNYIVGGMGLVNGDQLSGALATTASAGSNVGGYVITQGTLAASSNYLVTGFQAGTLAVIPREILVIADNQRRAYGEANPALTYTIGGSGLVQGDLLMGGLETAAGPNSVGSFAITRGSLQASANYALRFSPGTLTVLAAPEGNNSASTISRWLGQSMVLQPLRFGASYDLAPEYFVRDAGTDPRFSGTWLCAASLCR